jgi:internalin A
LPLKNLTNLKKLELSCGQVVDINPLASLLRLEDLDISFSTCENIGIDVLSNLKKLKHLKIDISSVSDLNPLGNLMDLKSLFLTDTKVSDLEPISNLKMLQVLLISNTYVTSLSPLRDLKALVRVDFDNTPITNIESILDLPNLEMISCIDCNLSQNQIEILKNHYYNARISHYHSRDLKSKSKNQGCAFLMIVGFIITIVSLVYTIVSQIT